MNFEGGQSFRQLGRLVEGGPILVILLLIRVHRMDILLDCCILRKEWRYNPNICSKYQKVVLNNDMVAFDDGRYVALNRVAKVEVSDVHVCCSDTTDAIASG